MSFNLDLKNLITRNKLCKEPYYILYDKEGEKISIGKDFIVDFFKLYCENKYDNEQENNNYYFEELVNDTIPIITEIKTDLNIEIIIKKHYELIDELLIISNRKKEKQCIILKKKNNSYKLQFPNCKIKTNFLKEIFHKKLKEKLNDEEYNFEIEEIKEKYELYNSSLNYDYLSCYNNKLEISQIHELFNYNSHNLLKNKKDINILEDEENDLNSNEEFKVNISKYNLSIKYFPIILSLNFSSKIIKVIEEFKDYNLIINENKKINEDIFKNKDEKYYNKCTEKDILKDLLHIISKKKYNSENYILDIGRSIKNVYNGEDEGLEIWKEYTKKYSDIFNENFCDNKYDNLDFEKLTIKTIGWYARDDREKYNEKDDNTKYEIWHEKWCYPKLKKCLENDKFPHVLIAKAFYNIYWLEFMFCNRFWIIFKNHKLKFSKGNQTILNIITNSFVPIFDKLKRTIDDEILFKREKLEDHVRQQKRLQINRIEKLIDKLHDATYRKQIVSEVSNLFNKDEIMNYFDFNQNLLGCKNCVIELTGNRAYPRNGKPEDFITKCLGVVYNKKYNMDSKNIKDALFYQRQVFPNDNIRNFFKKYIASCMYGKNDEKYLCEWIGATNGSKTIYQRIIRAIFGDYYCDMPESYYQEGNKKNSSGASPEEAQTSGARIVVTSELNPNINLNGNIIKKITGGQSDYNRALFDGGGSKLATFKAILIMNIVPQIKGLDEASKGRILQIPFEARWLRPTEEGYKDIPEDVEEQIKNKVYKIDYKFDRNIGRFAEAFLWLMVNKDYEIYKKEGLIPPQDIQNFIEDFWASGNDPYSTFIDEKLRKVYKDCDNCSDGECNIDNCNGSFIKNTNKIYICDTCNKICDKCEGKRNIINEQIKITGSQLYPIYSRWIKQNFNEKPDSKTVFISMISTKDKLGKQKNRSWRGWELFIPDSEV